MENQDEVQTEAIVSDSKVEVDNQSDDAVETGFIGPMRFLEELREERHIGGIVRGTADDGLQELL